MKIAVSARSVVALGLLAAAVIPAPRAGAGASDHLGYWTGLATLVFSSGAKETAKCVVTWRAGVAAEDLVQNIRCASPSYAINATAAVRIAAGKVNGSWEERTYAATGTVTGVADGASLRIAIAGPTFNAQMNVDSLGCRQSMVLAPTNLDVTQITFDLAKC
jgi:hypothetical protein